MRVFGIKTAVDGFEIIQNQINIKSILQNTGWAKKDAPKFQIFIFHEPWLV